jgi:hypothetical protein
MQTQTAVRTRSPQMPVSGDTSSPIQMIGSPMSFSRNAEIYGEGEAADYIYKVASGRLSIRCHEKRSFWLRRRSTRSQMRFTC